ncbi:hypothetical protein OJF2_60780 [Aquisphaera giovannonii]|uniref:DUF2314 domain-containing protein n=1 Tax=Aquisphaera giovannonii TaxID=406548 RepID=A0A5B9WAK2_9BACT|nr:hypothetical protein [Aquisphaera giovannonii]QEH37487.1 hypothetical protein OJF2_60780 [Aquisphaera giovannonii]
MAMRPGVLFVLLAGLAGGCSGEPAATAPPPLPKLSPNAPPDQPVQAKSQAQAEAHQAAIAPYVEQGRKTYPDAKGRYLAGLPADQHFFAVTNLHDTTGMSEQVFVAVTGIHGGRITGRIASEILGVKGFRSGDVYSFPESELVDWLITHPDGSEEGNVVGKFLDEWQKTQPLK